MNIKLERFTVPAPASGESTGASAAVGYETVAPKGVIDVTSFLDDRPPIPVEVPEEDAEIRWGAKSQFQYDATIGDYRNVPDYIIDPGGDSGGGVTWPPGDEEPLPPQDVMILMDLQEVEREVQEVRVSNPSDATMYVDIERIKTVTFELPERQGENGKIREFWRFHMNWGQQQ
jgi:hypothetical protein